MTSFNREDYVYEADDGGYFCEQCEGVGPASETVQHTDDCPIGQIDALVKTLVEVRKRTMQVWSDLRMGTGNEMLLFGANQLIDEALQAVGYLPDRDAAEGGQS